MLLRRTLTSDAARPTSRSARRARAGGFGILILALAVVSGSPVVALAAAPVVFAPAKEHETAPGYPWDWPVEDARRVVAPFRAPTHEYGPGHRGMDIAAAPSTPVRAPADGIVAFRGTVVDRPLLTIDHGAGHVTTWEPMQSTLSPGDVIESGAVIGTVASGGHAVRGALHVGVRVDDEYVNPSPLFGEVPRAVLLPCCE